MVDAHKAEPYIKIISIDVITKGGPRHKIKLKEAESDDITKKWMEYSGGFPQLKPDLPQFQKVLDPRP